MPEGSGADKNPERIPYSSPGLRGTSYPGLIERYLTNLEKVASGTTNCAWRGPESPDRCLNRKTGACFAKPGACFAKPEPESQNRSLNRKTGACFAKQGLGSGRQTCINAKQVGVFANLYPEIAKQGCKFSKTRRSEGLSGTCFALQGACFAKQRPVLQNRAGAGRFRAPVSQP